MDTKTIMATLPLLAVPFVAEAAEKAEANTRPNVILILTDDMGYSGITTFGGMNLHTPVLDKLAANGVVCTNFHTNAPVSSPTRASIMTGSYQQRVGLNHIYSEVDQMDGLDPVKNPAFVKLLQEAGYHTGVMGKWHLGQDNTFNPLHHGFDTFHGYKMGNIDFITHYNTQRRIDWWHNMEEKDEPGYVTDLINNYAVQFIEDTPKDQPFFLYVSHNAIHVPLQGRNDPPIRTATEYAYRTDQHMSVEEYQRVYREMIAITDEGVGMIVNKLEEKGIMDNTLIIFLSDNGGEAIAAEKYLGANGFYRGAKGQCYEGGIRVPAIFHYPRTMEHKRNDDMMLTMDLMPTILEFCNVKFNKKIDGTSLLPTLQDNKPMPERKVFWANIGFAVAQDGMWKLVQQKDKAELFNMMIDSKEAYDLSSIYPEKVESMKKDTDIWWKEVTKGTRLETLTPYDRMPRAQNAAGVGANRQ